MVIPSCAERRGPSVPFKRHQPLRNERSAVKMKSDLHPLLFRTCGLVFAQRGEAIADILTSRIIAKVTLFRGQKLSPVLPNGLR